MEEKLGAKYVERTRPDLAKALEDSSPATPVFFILSPGVDALKDLEILGAWPGGWPARPPPFLSVDSYLSFSHFFSPPFAGDGAWGNVRLITQRSGKKCPNGTFLCLA